MKKTAITLALSLALISNSLPLAWAAGPGENADQQWRQQQPQQQQQQQPQQQQQQAPARQEGRQDNRDNRSPQRQQASNAPQQDRGQGGEQRGNRQPDAPQGQRNGGQKRQMDTPNRPDRFAYGGHEFRKGQPAPQAFRGNDFRVNDWRARGLPAPPRGHHWSYIDGRYVLIAAATGIITSIILNSALQH